MTQRTITALLVGKKDGCLPKLEKGMKTAYVKTHPGTCLGFRNV
jgi:hypothetical protein